MTLRVATRIATTDADGPFPPARYAQFVVMVLMLVYTASFLDRQIISLMGERVRADLGLTDVQLSLLQGLSFALFYTALGIPMGVLADRFNRRTLILAGLVTWSVATALCGLADSFGWLFVARMLVGVGEATLAPAAYSLIADYFPQQSRARAMSIYSSGILVGSGLAYMLGGAILPYAEQIARVLEGIGIYRAGWQVAFFAASLPGVILPFMLLMVREPVRRERLPDGALRAGDGWRYVLERWRLYGTICGALSCMAAVNYGNFAWLPAVFQRAHGWTASQFGYAFGLILMILAPLGMLLGGTLMDRIRAQRPLQLALYISGAALLLMLVPAVLSPIVSDSRLALALIGLEMFLVAMPMTLGPIMLQLATPNEFRGRVMALYIFATNIVGLGLGPFTAAVISDRFFQNEQMIGAALAIQATLFLPLASLPLLWLARKMGATPVAQVPAAELP